MEKSIFEGRAAYWARASELLCMDSGGTPAWVTLLARLETLGIGALILGGEEPDGLSDDALASVLARAGQRNIQILFESPHPSKPMAPYARLVRDNPSAPESADSLFLYGQILSEESPPFPVLAAPGEIRIASFLRELAKSQETGGQKGYLFSPPMPDGVLRRTPGTDLWNKAVLTLLLTRCGACPS